MKEVDRFRTKFNNSSENGCWTWIASKTQQGYGMFSYEGKSIPAHRFAYIPVSYTHLTLPTNREV